MLLPLFYNGLHRLAKSWMRRKCAGHTLQPTALFHEGYLRLMGDERTREKRAPNHDR